jgi:hypothetical protein
LGRGISRITATIIDGMKPEYIGRVLGIGVRVAGRVAGQRIAEAASAPASPQVTAGARVRGSGSAQAGQAGRAAAQTGHGVAKGVGGLVSPFRKAGGILWLEITGAFFLLPVVVFAPTVWQTRLSWASGPDHKKFIASVIVVGVFLYLGLSSFWRARRKAKA